jgi:hypothetical protein
MITSFYASQLPFWATLSADDQSPRTRRTDCLSAPKRPKCFIVYSVGFVLMSCCEVYVKLQSFGSRHSDNDIGQNMRTEIRNLQGESGVLGSFFHTNSSQTSQVSVESTKFYSLTCFVPFSGKSSKCELSLLFWDFSQNHWFRSEQTLPQHLAHYIRP